MSIKDFNSTNGKTYSLYNGEVKLNFKESGHQYEVNGKEVVGVTTVLRTVIAKEALVNWAVKMTANYILENWKPDRKFTLEEIGKIVENAKKQHRLEKEKAGTLGSDVHEWIKNYIKAKITKLPIPPLPENKDYLIPINAFLKWEREGNIIFKESERVVYSKKYGYAGTLDFTALVNNNLMLGDIKTSNYIYPESYFLQLAAYRYALEEENSQAKIKGMFILRVPKTKDSQLEIMIVNNYEENAKAFLYGLGLYRQITKLKNFYNKGGEKQ